MGNGPAAQAATIRLMNRREFLQTGSALAGAAGCGRTEQRRAKKPNVLLLYTDEHSHWTLGAYGGKVAGTPHLDSIGREGAVFNNFFVNSAVCTPSRGCLMTGRYPHRHGAYRNYVRLGSDNVTIAELFRRAGYETGMAGKWHLDGAAKPGWMPVERSMGFDDCRWMYNTGHWKRVVERPAGWPENRSTARQGKRLITPSEPDGMPDVDYDVGAEGEFFTDWLADKCIEFIRRPRSSPFFYYLSIPDPHTPYSVAPPYDTMFRPEDMEPPATLFEKDLPDWAEEARTAKLAGEKADGPFDPRRVQVFQQRMARYCGMIRCIDDNVGRILAALRAADQLDNTIVLFTSDHGNYMGEHGLYNKNQLYETAHHVAMLARYPAKIAAGTVVDDVVATVDFLPAVCRLAGVSTAGREEGRGMFDGSAGDRAWIHHSSLQRAGVFTPDWEFALVQGGDGILFDRRNDPQQTNNLFADPAHAAVVASLRVEVTDHCRDVRGPELKWLT